jgi:uncharacterized protein YndB with AHSA1/START domain
MTTSKAPSPASSSAADGTTVELLGDTDILVTRHFQAPARLVFEALTKPEHVRRWWSPRSRGEMTECAIDFRVGGAYRYAMRTLGGDEVGFSGTILEIDAPHRYVCTEVFDPFPESVSTITTVLVEKAGTTTMQARMSYPSAMVREQVIASGMESGMRESYVQLTAVVAGLR